MPHLKKRKWVPMLPAPSWVTSPASSRLVMCLGWYHLPQEVRSRCRLRHCFLSLCSHSTLHVFLSQHITHHCVFVYISVSPQTPCPPCEGTEDLVIYLPPQTWQDTGVRELRNTYKVSERITKWTPKFAANFCPMGKIRKIPSPPFICGGGRAGEGLVYGCKYVTEWISRVSLWEIWDEMKLQFPLL